MFENKYILWMHTTEYIAFSNECVQHKTLMELHTESVFIHKYISLRVNTTEYLAFLNECIQHRTHRIAHRLSVQIHTYQP